MTLHLEILKKKIIKKKEKDRLLLKLLLEAGSIPPKIFATSLTVGELHVHAVESKVNNARCLL